MAERLLRMDMHSHTHASFDCLCPPERILETARERGIDRLVVTDHNEVSAALELHRMDPERILVGEEVKTAEGADVIGILLREQIPKGTPARETCERIREQGGVVYLPHPFDTRRSGGGHLLDRLADLVDVVEAHNARTWKRGVNLRGERWALDHGKLLGAGSDSHTLGEMGRAFVEVPPFEPTREGLLAALRAGRIAGRGVASPLVAVASTYAKVHKALRLG
ncbi:MAG TPA: PHP domain-containing protein [Longimicrobiaceae bacterium]|nr:PHP domain-containing protein [Longimicrobiaceae bacterium]